MSTHEREHDDLVRHPHDALVQRMLTRPETAVVELKAALPGELQAHLDWSTLYVEPGSYIDPKLRPRRSDILYSIALRGSRHRVFVHVLMEHQSSLDRLMAWRLLVYAVRIWERYVKEHQGPVEALPMIVPLVLFHGPKGWTMPQRLSQLLDVPPELLASMTSPIELTFAVDDLHASVIDDQHVRDLRSLDRAVALAEAVRTLLWLASSSGAVDRPRVEALGPLLETIRDAWGADDLQALLTYIVSAFKQESTLPDILFGSASKETRLMYTTIRDQLIADGVAKGMAKGMGQMLERLLDTRGLRLTDELRARIAGCRDETRLQRWFDRAVTASTLTEVFGD